MWFNCMFVRPFVHSIVVSYTILAKRAGINSPIIAIFVINNNYYYLYHRLFTDWDFIYTYYAMTTGSKNYPLYLTDHLK